MSRVAKQAIAIPKGVELKINGQNVEAKGAKGAYSFHVHPSVKVTEDEGLLKVSPVSEEDYAMAGTMRSLLNNVIIGVSEGFSRKLELVGVGYRAQAKGNVLGLTLGFSHPIDYQVPAGIQIDTPSQTEIIISGVDKVLVGQVAADIRGYRPPEPYKGKGVRYANEQILRKEAKKK